MIDLEPKSSTDAAWWDAQYRDGQAKALTLWDRRLTELVARELPPKAHVLMLACGTAIAVEMLNARRPDLSWTLCDYSAEALAIARGKFGLNFVGLVTPNVEEYVQADLSQPWPWPNDSFDAVICTELLEHLEDPVAALNEMQRVSLWAAVTMPVHPDTLIANPRWKFQPEEMFRMVRYTRLVHHLREGKLLLGIIVRPGGYDRKQR